MTLDVNLRDGRGTKNTAQVDDEGSLHIAVQPAPPLEPQKIKIFRQFLTDDGTATGNTAMDVDGSLTNVEFWIEASQDNDRYITAVSFLLAKSGSTLNEFGNGAALTNGCQFEYQRQGETVSIHEELKSNFDIVRLCLGNPAFGTGNGAFRVNNAIATDEAFIPVMDFTSILPPYGIKLDKGSKQKLIFRIRDDLTASSRLDNFDVIGYGFDRFK